MTDSALSRKEFPPTPFSKNYKVPVNIKRLVWNAQKMFQIRSNGESDMSPTYVIRRTRELCEGLWVVTGEDNLSQEAQLNATMLFKILVSERGYRNRYHPSCIPCLEIFTVIGFRWL